MSSQEESCIRDGDYLGYRVSVRLVREGCGSFTPRAITGPEDCHRFLRDLESLDREVFYAIHLDTRRRIISCEEVSKGTLRGASVHPREVYKAAILSSADAIIVAHNHPSGDPTPSPDDRAITERLHRAGELLGIPLLDHVIIGHGTYFSVAGEQPSDGGNTLSVREDTNQALHSYYGRVRSYLGRFATRSCPIDDLVQETFVQAYQTIRNRGPPRDNSLYWLLTVAKRTAITQNRKASVRHTEPLTEVIDHATVEPSEVASQHERKQQLTRTLASLPNKHQRLLHEYYTLGMSCAELAARYGATHNAIKGRLYRARQRLKKHLLHTNNHSGGDQP